MVKLQYLPPVGDRDISSEAWGAVGIKNHDTVVWDASNNHIAEVSDEAAEYLVGKYPNEFAKVEDKAADDEEAAEAKEETSKAATGSDVDARNSGGGPNATQSTGANTSGGGTGTGTASSQPSTGGATSGPSGSA